MISSVTRATVSTVTAVSATEGTIALGVMALLSLAVLLVTRELLSRASFPSRAPLSRAVDVAIFSLIMVHGAIVTARLASFFVAPE